MRAEDVIAELERLYPNDIMLLEGKSEKEVTIYMANLKTIELIKSFVKDS